MTTTAWPTGAQLVEWVGNDTLSSASIALADELVADATETIRDRIDTDKLPTDTAQCPRPVARAIVLEAARLLSRKGSAHGIVSFGEFAVRIATVDVDIERLLAAWRLDPEP